MKKLTGSLSFLFLVSDSFFLTPKVSCVVDWTTAAGGKLCSDMSWILVDGHITSLVNVDMLAWLSSAACDISDEISQKIQGKLREISLLFRIFGWLFFVFLLIFPWHFLLCNSSRLLFVRTFLNKTFWWSTTSQLAIYNEGYLADYNEPENSMKTHVTGENSDILLFRFYSVCGRKSIFQTFDLKNSLQWNFEEISEKIRLKFSPSDVEAPCLRLLLSATFFLVRILNYSKKIQKKKWWFKLNKIFQSEKILIRKYLNKFLNKFFSKF